MQYKVKPNSERVPLVVTYNPLAHKLKQIAKSLQYLLDEDPDTKEMFPAPPIIAYRQPANLKKILVKSKLTEEVQGTFPCRRPRCKSCAVMTHNNNITINNDSTYTPVGHFDCLSSDLVYLITCKKCSDTRYIGETSQQIRNRLTGHRQLIRDNLKDFPIVKHFNRPNHDVNDIKVTILKGPIPNIRQRRTEEQKLIHLFKATRDEGLNIDLGCMSNYL